MATTITTSGENPDWGRVLICGGTDWPKLGRKDRSGGQKTDEDQPFPDLLEPHILRSLSNVAITSIHTSCSGCHFVCIDSTGIAWLFGRNTSSALGIEGYESVSENAPLKLKPEDLGLPSGVKFISAACGRNHSLLVADDGSVWSAGANTYGQCGHPPCAEISAFKAIPGLSAGNVKEKAVKVAAGITFSLVLTQSNRVFSFGSGEKGQLGNGTTGERITTGNKVAYDIEFAPILIKELDGKKITDIACGQQHSIAIDDTGMVYVWGYNGYCRLGLGDQKDRLKPIMVEQFSSTSNHLLRAAKVFAGPSNSVVVDRQGMYYMAGKWKNSGDGSSGSPYSTFRVMQDVMGCKVLHAACGGVTHWLITPDDDSKEGGNMTVCFGQGASNGELGLGPDEPKSATKPTKNVPLTGIEVFQIAAAQNTTLFLAKPNEQFSDLPRHPEDVNAPPACLECGKDTGDEDPPLECDKCDGPYHLGCLSPPLTTVPPGEWFCQECQCDPGAPIGAEPPKRVKKSKAGEEPEEDQGGKRSAAAKGGNVAKKKRQ